MNRFIFPFLLVAMTASPTALANSDLTGSVSRKLEVEVRRRAQLGQDADVHVAAVRIAHAGFSSGAIAVKRVELPVGEDGLGRVAAKALLVATDGSESWTWVQAQVDASVPTVVAAHALKRGTTLGPADLDFKMLPLERYAVTQLSQPVGQLLKRSVRAGEPLRVTWLTAPMAIQRGDRVETIVHRGSVFARGSGEAAERGRVGDIIRVRLTHSRRILRARVLDSRRVEVIR